jgi:hypothetical protein
MRVILTAVYALALIVSSSSSIGNHLTEEKKAVADYQAEVKSKELVYFKTDVEAFRNAKSISIEKMDEFIKEVEAFHKANAALEVTPDYKLDEVLAGPETFPLNAEQLKALVRAFNRDGALMMVHIDYFVEKFNDADKHAMAVVKMLTDAKLLESAKLDEFINKVLEFYGSRSHFKAIDDAQGTLTLVYNNINRQSHRNMATLKEVLDKAKKALDNSTDAEKKVLTEAVTKAQTDVNEVNELLIGDDGLSANYKKFTAAYNKTIPQTMTQNVKSGLGEAQNDNVVLIVCSSIAAVLIIGAAVYFFVLKKH